MQCKVDSRWAPDGFRCCAMWFGVLECRHIHQKKVRAQQHQMGAFQEIARLGRTKACCINSNTHREETGSHQSPVVFGYYGNSCLRKAGCHLLPSSKLTLADDLRMGFEIRSNWFRRQDLPCSRAPGRSCQNDGRTEESQAQPNTPMNPSDLLAETDFEKRTSSKKHHPAGPHFEVQNLAPKVGALMRRNGFAASVLGSEIWTPRSDQHSFFPHIFGRFSVRLQRSQTWPSMLVETLARYLL